MPLAEGIKQQSWLHPVRRLDALAAQRPGLRQLGTALKYLTPILTPATTAILYLASPGATTVLGLFFYAALGGATGLFTARGAAKSFRLARTEREAAATAAQLQGQIERLRTEKQTLVDRLDGVERKEGRKRVTIEGMLVQVEKVLGEGGMAIVLKIKELAHNVIRAYKVPNPESLGEGISLERFRKREASSMAQLGTFKRVVQYFRDGYMDRNTYRELLGVTLQSESELPEKIPYLVMEFIDHPDLQNRINQGGVTVEWSLKIALEIAKALRSVSTKGIIHRDLKPSNVFVVPDEDTGEDTVKLTDFGLAKTSDQPAVRKTNEGFELAGEIKLSQKPRALTNVGMTGGTNEYMSPEQYQGMTNVDWRTDQYALGALIFEMLTGQPPFGIYDGQFMEYFSKVYHNPVPDLTQGLAQQLGSKAAQQIQLILNTTLAKKPELRFESWDKVIDMLEKAIHFVGVSADGKSSLKPQPGVTMHLGHSLPPEDPAKKK